MSMNTIGHDILANIIMYIFKHDTITGADIINRFKLSIEATTNVITMMGASGIIGTEEAGVHPVTVKCLDDINEGIVEFLNDHGFTKEMIVDAFKALPTEKKEEVSIILRENRNWRDAETTMPEIGLPVAIRLLDRSKIYTENRSEVLYAEDIKIAQWDGEKWTILPPYPKFDYSPLSKFGELNEGVAVSHWGDVLVEELHAWQRRFDRFHGYNLKIEVDPDYEEEVYRALMWGAAYISKFGGPDFNNDDPDNGLRKMYTTLCDMQACMDIHKSEDAEVPDIAITVADKVVAWAADVSTNGTFDFTYKEISDIAPDKNEYNRCFFDILQEIKSRDEILDVDVDFTVGKVMLSINPRFCTHYEWQEGDEEIFECSKEEWEKLPILHPVLRRGDK